LEINEQRHIAEVLADYRERLEAARKDLSAELDTDGIPVDPIAARILAVEARMLDVENFITADLGRRERRARFNLPARCGMVTAPRLGRLAMHPPRPLRVPTTYYIADPPSPAPTISIVTPSFRHGRFLERTLYSVVSQHYPALEYVVQDGGSTDGTREILERYEPALTAWASEPDCGQADAINRGFARTSGELMAYLNSDDLLLPGALAYVAAYFTAHPDVDVVYGHRHVIDEGDSLIGSWVLPPHDDLELTLVDFVPQETLFWRRRAWEAAGGAMDTDFDFALDWDLLLRLRESGARMVRLPRFLGAFRVHDEQKTATATDRCLLECDRLRRRVHGRTLSHDEAVARATPYLRRHVRHQLRYALRSRLPMHRSQVRVLPQEPWLREHQPAPVAAVPEPELGARA